MAKSSRDYENGVYREHAEIHISPIGMSRVDLLGPYVQAAAEKTASKPDKQGWVRCTLPIEDRGFGIRELLRLGDEFELLGPPALREQMVETLNAMKRRY